MEAADNPGLGTLLRHLTELLDGDLAAIYASLGIEYRPRYTPVYRMLLEQPQATIRDIAAHAGISHSAASQTVTDMARHGLVEMRTGEDRRERQVRLTRKGRAMQAKVQSQWRATALAADSLDRELSTPLSKLLLEAIALLEKTPFRERIARKRQPGTTRGPNP